VIIASVSHKTGARGEATGQAIDWAVTTTSAGNLAESHQRMVYRLARQLLGDHDDALDLPQDVFLTVFRSFHWFRGDSTLQTWIYRVVVNHAARPAALVAATPTLGAGLARRCRGRTW